MSGFTGTADGGLYRNTDRALLGGVCAGLADYFGFNLCVTRILAVIAFCMAGPIAVIAYFTGVFLMPANSGGRRKRADRKSRRAARKADDEPRPTRADTIKEAQRRFESLDQRLARMEKYVTSSRYQLDREFEKL